MISLRVYALAVIVLTGQAMGQCPPDYEHVDDECYRFFNGIHTTWEGARTVCHDDGAGLAIFKDCDHFANVVRHIHVNELEPDVAYWIGGTDAGGEGDWSWVDDSQMQMGVPFWGRGELLDAEPSGGTVENCAGLMAEDRYYIHDLTCENHAPAICELPLHEPGTPCPTDYIPIDTKCFFINPEVRGNWTEQRINCESIGSDLAVLDTCRLFTDVIDFIHINGLEVHGSFWVGGTDRGNEGDWNWVNGEPMHMGVPYWGRVGNGTIQPDNDVEQQNCASMRTDDRLTFHDDDCDVAEGHSPLCHWVPLPEN